MNHRVIAIFVALIGIVTVMVMIQQDERSQPDARRVEEDVVSEVAVHPENKTQEKSILIDRELAGGDGEYGSRRDVSVHDLQAFEESDSVLLFFTLARYRTNLGDEAITSGQSAPPIFTDSGQFVATVTPSGEMTLREITNPKNIDPRGSMIFKHGNRIYLWDGLSSIGKGLTFFRFAHDTWVETEEDELSALDLDIDLDRKPIGTTLGNSTVIRHLALISRAEPFYRIAHSGLHFEIDDKFESRKHSLRFAISGYNILASSTREPFWEVRVFPFAK